MSYYNAQCCTCTEQCNHTLGIDCPCCQIHSIKKGITQNSMTNILGKERDHWKNRYEKLKEAGNQMYRAIVYTSDVDLNFAADEWIKARKNDEDEAGK